MTVPCLTGRGLHKHFGPTHALRGVDIDIYPGQTIAIMGPSGSGKSTLLHVLAGVLTPEEGRVDFAGQELSALDEERRCQLRLENFGFVFQFGQLLPDLSALDNVVLPLLLAKHSRRTATRQAAKLLAELGLAEHQTKYPAQLSGGQAQRVAVARALALRPRVLFADEPTGSLDSLAAEHTMEAFLNAVRATNTALVLVTHDPRTAAWAEREITMRDGRITADSGAVGGPQ